MSDDQGMVREPTWDELKALWMGQFWFTGPSEKFDQGVLFDHWRESQIGPKREPMCECGHREEDHLLEWSTYTGYRWGPCRDCECDGPLA